jgi:hypothetical protein
MASRIVAPENIKATPMGFEPTISTVTGWHVSPLHYGATLRRILTYPTNLYQPKSSNMRFIMSSQFVCLFEQAITE